MANLMTSELFPAEVRALCKVLQRQNLHYKKVMRINLFQGAARSLTCVLILFSLKIYPLLEQTMLLFGTFYFYGAVVLLLLPIIMKVLPETKVSDICHCNYVAKSCDYTFSSLTIAGNVILADKVQLY